ncbi:MAG: uracil-DNA glycosylase [Clostridia bacterium]|nr:uracil-DNA glycosylase [Clostridia bacterium]
MSKTDLLKSLYSEYSSEFEGNEIVLGEGNVDAKILLIGEAPGKDEVRLSKPFVGAAGKNLNEFLDILNVKREDIYITNSIKYRLSKLNPESGRVINRPATKNEININQRYLLEEIKIIKPLFIVTLGNVPLKAVTGIPEVSVGKVHGSIMKVDIAGSGFDLYPLYHPASIIYNRSLKEVYINDILKLKSILLDEIL